MTKKHTIRNMRAMRSKRTFKIISILCITCIISFIAACASTSNNGLGNPANPKSYRFAGNTWNTLGNHFYLPGETTSNPEVLKQINWYMGHQKYLIDVAEQARPYLYYIYQQVRRRNLPAELALLPMIESRYDPISFSKVGAAGLWQIMPSTASGFGLKINWWYDGRRDVIASTDAALNYLTYLGKFFNNNWILAIAAYDTGEGAVQKAIRHNYKIGKNTDFWHLPLAKETKNYIPKLLALATIIKHPYEYPVAWPRIKNAPYLAKVNVKSQIDLSRAAKMANIDMDEFIQLNPGFNRWTTDPDGPFELLLPINKAAAFKKQLAKLPKSKRITWKRYKVKAGDSLTKIAHEFKTTVPLLQHANELKNDVLQLGHQLLIPTATTKLTHTALKTKQHYLSLAKRKIPEIKITQYTVKKGNTLATIARKYNVKPRQILFWNGLKNSKQLKVGKKLILWPPHKKHYSQHILLSNYKVHSGDSLSAIAHRYHITTTKLKKTNHLKHNTIKIGQLLKVPKITRHKVKTKKYAKKKTLKHKKHQLHRLAYQVKFGDTLSGIAKQHKITAADLKRWNRIDNPNHLKLHQTLVLYV